MTERATLPDLTLPTTTPRAKTRGRSKAKNCTTAKIQIPESLNTEAFKAAWSEWQQHRREARKPLTPTAERQQLGKLEAWGADRAVAAIRQSLANGWQGLFEPRCEAGGQELTFAESEAEAERRISANLQAKSGA